MHGMDMEKKDQNTAFLLSLQLLSASNGQKPCQDKSEGAQVPVSLKTLTG